LAALNLLARASAPFRAISESSASERAFARAFPPSFPRREVVAGEVSRDGPARICSLAVSTFENGSESCKGLMEGAELSSETAEFFLVVAIGRGSCCS